MVNTLNKFRKPVIFTILLFFLILILYLLSSILIPFIVGALLAYLCNPLVNKLIRLSISRIIATSIVFFFLFLCIFLLFLLLIPLIQNQITVLSEIIPRALIWIQQKIMPQLLAYFNIPGTNNVEAVKTILSENLMKAGGIIGWFLQAILHSGRALFNSMLNIILIPVVTFYLLRDWDSIYKKIPTFIPTEIRPGVIKLAKESDVVLSAFFRGQLLIMLCLSIFYAIGLSIIGLQIGILIGIISGLLSVVPYLGLIVGIIAASIAAIIQFGTLTSIFDVLIVFLIGLCLENFYLTPKLIGDRIGLHPVIVIFAILAGGTLFGFFGVLLALPVASVLLVLLKHFHLHYKKL